MHDTAGLEIIALSYDYPGCILFIYLIKTVIYLSRTLLARLDPISLDIRPIIERISGPCIHPTVDTLRGRRLGISLTCMSGVDADLLL